MDYSISNKEYPKLWRQKSFETFGILNCHVSKPEASHLMEKNKDLQWSRIIGQTILKINYYLPEVSYTDCSIKSLHMKFVT